MLSPLLDTALLEELDDEELLQPPEETLTETLCSISVRSPTDEATLLAWETTVPSGDTIHFVATR